MFLRVINNRVVLIFECDKVYVYIYIYRIGFFFRNNRILLDVLYSIGFVV